MNMNILTRLIKISVKTINCLPRWQLESSPDKKILKSLDAWLRHRKGDKNFKADKTKDEESQNVDLFLQQGFPKIFVDFLIPPGISLWSIGHWASHPNETIYS